MGVICAGCGDEIGIALSYPFVDPDFPPGITLHYLTGCFGHWYSQPAAVRRDRLAELGRMVST